MYPTATSSKSGLSGFDVGAAPKILRFGLGGLELVEGSFRGVGETSTGRHSASGRPVEGPVGYSSLEVEVELELPDLCILESSRLMSLLPPVLRSSSVSGDVSICKHKKRGMPINIYICFIFAMGVGVFVRVLF